MRGRIYKIEIPIYRSFGIFSSVFGIFRYLEYRLRYRYRYFEIPRKTRIMGLPCSEDSLTIDWAVSIQYQRTDGQIVQPISVTCAVWLTHVKNSDVRVRLRTSVIKSRSLSILQRLRRLWTRSSTVSAAFCADLADVLDRLNTFVKPLFVVGDLNVHWERSTDSPAIQPVDLFTDYGSPRQLMLLVVCLIFLLLVTICLCRHVLDVGGRPVGSPTSSLVSFHESTTTCLHYNIVRPWRELNAVAFRQARHVDELWCCHHVHSLASLYDAEISALLDSHRTVTGRRCPSDPWFDHDCHEAKRCTRRQERASSRANRAATTDQTAAKVTEASASATAWTWTTERRTYRDLLRQKNEAFWQTKIESDRSTPCRL